MRGFSRGGEGDQRKIVSSERPSFLRCCGLIAATVALIAALLSGLPASPAADGPEESKNTPTAEGEERAAATERGDFQSTMRPFLNKYCVQCHGPDKQKGERRFDRLVPRIQDDNSLVDFQDILDQLNLGEMPPQEVRQPTAAERRQVVGWLTARIQEYHDATKGSGGETVLCRLNAREYRNTVRDLLHLNMTMFDPTEKFPRDQTTEHLDNVGETLVTSGHLLVEYLEAADRVVEKALAPRREPTVRSWTFRAGFRQQPEIDQVHRHTNEFRHMTLYDVVGADKHEGAYGPILAFKEGVPLDGYYELRLKAEAVNREHPYDPEFLGTDPDEPLRLGIVAGNYLAGPLHKPQPNEPLLAEIPLADEPAWYTTRIWLDAGFTPRFTFQNGLMDARTLWTRILRRYPDLFPKPRRPGIVEARMTAIKFGKLPQIRIHEIEIKGPYRETWPTASQQALLGPDCEQILQSGEMTDEQIRQRLTPLATRAYRRPVGDAEVERIMQVVATRRSAGRSGLEAFADGVKALLCSPNFLYLDEPAGAETQGAELSPYALASRLSYFLWSSMPDEELSDLAAADRLRDPDVLRKQVARMLNDPRSNAFIEGFLAGWLTLRDLGSMPPDRSQFREYYHYDLGRAMRQETRLFTRHLLDENLSVQNFLQSDFTFVNKPLARLYGLEPPAEPGFHRVALNNSRRGGLLGQASVLTVTANGIDTSPIVRGVWVLENILGTPPAPPPPDVEPLDPDVRGAKTIREQLMKHRSVGSCYDCHRSIDPLGFALENFDPIGRWRDTYEKRAAIDASGQLPSGEQFEDVAGLKQLLAGRRDQFATALTEKLLAYAVGRELEPRDRPHVTRIVQQLGQRGYGMRDLIELVVSSQAFRSP